MKIMRTTKEMTQGLKDLVNFCDLKEAKMLEIGSYLGESSRIFAESECFSEIHCLDMWAGGYDNTDYASYNMCGVESNFLKNMSEFAELITVHKRNSLEIPTLFEDGYFDFIYIDGNHKKEAVENDIKSCIPKIKKGGYLSGHDYGNRDFSVTEAVDGILVSPDCVFKDMSWVKKIN